MDNLNTYATKITGLSEVMSDGNSDFRIVEKNSISLRFDLPVNNLVIFKYQVYSSQSSINTKIYVDDVLLRSDKFDKAKFIDKRFSFTSKGKFNLRIDYICDSSPCNLSQIRQYDSRINVVSYPEKSHLIGLGSTLYEYNSQNFPLSVQGLGDLLFEEGKFYRELKARDISIYLNDSIRPLHLVLTVAGDSGFSVELRISGQVIEKIYGDQINSVHGVFDLSSIILGSDLKLRFRCNDGGYACVKIEQLGLALSDSTPITQYVVANYIFIFVIFLSIFSFLIRRVKPQKIQNNSP